MPLPSLYLLAGIVAAEPPAFSVVFSIADRITVLHQGRIVAAGTPAEVRASAEVQRVYFGVAEWLWKSLASTPTTG